MSQISERMPEWVTALEAAVLTGLSEESILEAARRGAIGSAPLKMGRRGNGSSVLMIRFLDARAMAAAPVEASVAPVASPPVASPPVASPPVASPAAAPIAPPLERVEPTPPLTSEGRAAEWSSSSAVWGERPSDWRSIAPPAHPERGTVMERLRDPKALVTILVALALLATAVIVIRPHHTTLTTPRTPVVFGPSPRSVVLLVTSPMGTLVAVIGVPAGHTPTVLAVPADTIVTLPAGDQTTIGATAATGPVAQAAVQGLVLRRVGHYLAGTMSSLSGLIDLVGGIDVVTESGFTFGGHTVGSGNVHLSGSMADAYLSQGTTDDLTGRWEDVLTGIFGSTTTASEWAALGPSDDGSVVGHLMVAARNGPVLELPTTPGDGGVVVDRDGLTTLLDTKFGVSLGTLIRVVVVNGSGTPGLGTLIDGKLAPYGFSVVASQNARRFNVSQTIVVASGDAFLLEAQQAATVLGVGRVRVSDQPTEVADLTILVGKDLSRKH
jgi:hypothetical protein